MFKKILFLTLLALSPIFAFSGIVSYDEPSKIAILVPLTGCDLAAPTGFGVLERGTTWVRITWTPTVGGVDHRIRTYRSSDGLLVDNQIVTAAMAPQLLINGLQPGETYFCRLNAICPDGTDSKHLLTGPDFDTIITELIVIGITPQEGSQSCAINATGQFCNFYTDGTTNVFKVRRNDGKVIKQFNVRKPIGAGSNIGVLVNLNNAPLEFKVDNIPGNPNFPVPGRFFQVFEGSTLVASFDLYTVTNNTGRLRWVGGNGEYFIQRTTEGPSGLAGGPVDGKITELDDNSTAAQDRVTPVQTSAELGMVMVSPNPFSDNLDVYLPQNAADQVRFQLFNLSGQKVLDQQYTSGQDQYSLSTANLSPGFYMLRIEADGEIQTLKVVKSE